MAESDNPFAYFNNSLEVIRLVVMMYVKYPLSLRKPAAGADKAQRCKATMEKTSVASTIASHECVTRPCNLGLGGQKFLWRTEKFVPNA